MGLWKLIFCLGKEKWQFQRTTVFDFFFSFWFLLLTSENISTDSQQKDRANVCCAHCYISQAQTTVRAPGFASLVKSAGLRLGFSKPLRVGARWLGAHVGDPCSIWMLVGKPWELAVGVRRSSVSHGEGPLVSGSQDLSEVLNWYLWKKNIKALIMNLE